MEDNGTENESPGEESGEQGEEGEEEGEQSEEEEEENRGEKRKEMDIEEIAGILKRIKNGHMEMKPANQVNVHVVNGTDYGDHVTEGVQDHGECDDDELQEEEHEGDD